MYFRQKKKRKNKEREQKRERTRRDWMSLHCKFRQDSNSTTEWHPQEYLHLHTLSQYRQQPKSIKFKHIQFKSSNKKRRAGKRRKEKEGGRGKTLPHMKWFGNFRFLKLTPVFDSLRHLHDDVSTYNIFIYKERRVHISMKINQNQSKKKRVIFSNRHTISS
jgi:hypothetical protein